MVQDDPPVARRLQEFLASIVEPAANRVLAKQVMGVLERIVSFRLISFWVFFDPFLTVSVDNQPPLLPSYLCFISRRSKAPHPNHPNQGNHLRSERKQRQSNLAN